MKTRISEAFRKLHARGKKAFIPYIMAGDPSLEETRAIVRLFEDCGADVVELGVPFSDPLADGPTIQRAAERALSKGTTLRSVIALVSSLREITQIPIVLMTYFNPVFRYGTGDFITDAKNAGIDGIIVPDLPPDEAAYLVHESRRHGLDTIFLLAPTSTEERIKKVIKSSSGFVYYVSITGITGANLLLDGTMEKAIARIRSHTKKPVAVGFGVSTPRDAARIAGLADGVIIGSAIVKRLQESPDTLKDYLIRLREAIA